MVDSSTPICRLHSAIHARRRSDTDFQTALWHRRGGGSSISHEVRSGHDDGRDYFVDGFSEGGVVCLVALGRDGRKLPL